MRAILQRVSSASVTVEGRVVGQITGPGILALVGVAKGDGQTQVDTIVRKIAELRLFDGDDGELSAMDLGAPILVVSQFTLYGDTRKGRRPSWSHAAPGPEAEPLVDAVVRGLRARGLPVEEGVFGAMMEVALVNDGPFTLLVEA
ncbi:MAG: D-aminoacyl-tRNA deacylase [Actinomycetaceae bacterium]|nr:D-aminoacyl-tRNA deacylase [Actinomycetaceae bacterium]